MAIKAVSRKQPAMPWSCDSPCGIAPSPQAWKEAPLDPELVPPSLEDRIIAVVAVLLLSFATWLVARWAAWQMKERTRLGLRGLERLAGPLSLLTLAGGGQLVIWQVEEPPVVKSVLDLLLIVAGLWLAVRLLDAVFETGKRSARLRADPVAGAALLTAHHVAKAVVVLSVIAVIAVRLGAAEQLYLALGALGAALVFAARDPIRNAVAFVAMIIDPPFHVGDRVHIGDFRGGSDVEGTVMDINLGSITVRTRSRSLVVVTHATLLTLRVENLSAANRRRLEFILPVPPDMPPEDVREACDAIEKELRDSPQVVEERRPHVWVTGLGDGLHLKASLWLKRGTDRRQAQRDLLLAANARLMEKLPNAGSSEPT